jgi:hypothetical protein
MTKCHVRRGAAGQDGQLSERGGPRSEEPEATSERGSHPLRHYIRPQERPLARAPRLPQRANLNDC